MEATLRESAGRFAVALAAVALLGLAGAPTVGAGAVAQAKLYSIEPHGNDYFGGELAVDNGTAVVGANNALSSLGRVGAAEVLVRDGTGAWAHQARLVPPDGAGGDGFGGSVDVHRDTLVVGSPYSDPLGTDSGSAYVYVRSGTTWTLVQRIVPEDGASYDRFGRSVAIDGETLVVGADLDDDRGGSSGSVYVYAKINGSWLQRQKLTASDGQTSDFFGTDVDLHAGTLVATAVGDDPSYGSAYVFTRNASVWVERAKITAPDAGTNHDFGASVAIQTDTILVGAQGDAHAGSRSGSAYVFRGSQASWAMEGKLTAFDAASYDYFGMSVALDGPFALVGALYDDDVAQSTGSAYLFERVGGAWQHHDKVTAPDAQYDDRFGAAVALEADAILVGALADDDASGDSGAVYAFVLDVTPPVIEAKPEMVLDSTDPAGAVVTYTPPDAVDDLDGSVPVSCAPESGATFPLGTTSVACQATDAAGNTAHSTFLVTVRFVGRPPLEERAELFASDAASGDFLGSAVATDGSILLAGAPEADGMSVDSGAAYVFVNASGTWIEELKLVAPDGGVNDSFGKSVAVSGDTFVVGAPEHDGVGSNSGAAYVFVRASGSWSYEAKLQPSDAAGGDWFGHAVAISGDTIVVGSPLDDDAGSASGSAYVFKRSDGAWTQQAKLVASDAAGADYFGWSVAASGDTAAVGSYFDDDYGTSSGGAYVFVRSGDAWTQQAKVTPSDGEPYGYFGYALAIDRDTLLVGAYGADGPSGSLVGSAYVFTRASGAWSQQAELSPSNATGVDRFGESVAIRGDVALVGASGDTTRGSGSGAAYVFLRDGDTWAPRAKRFASDAQSGDRFGHAVGMSGRTALVGARLDDDRATSAGAVYVLEPDITPPHVAAHPDVLAEATSASGAIVTFATPLATDNVDGTRPVSCAPASGSTFPLGSTYVTCTATDLEGNAGASTFVVTVADTTPPEVAAAPDVAVVAPSPAGAVVVYTPPAWTDAVDGTGTATCGPESGSTFAIGTTAVVCHHTDAAGNLGANTFLVAVSYDSPAAVEERAVLLSTGFEPPAPLHVAIENGTAAIGTSNTGEGGAWSAADVCEREGGDWPACQLVNTPLEQLLWYAPPDVPVDLSRDRLVIGHPYTDDGTLSAGAVHLFVRSGDGWAHEARLTGPDRAADDLFGAAVALSGETLAIAAPGRDATGNNSGIVYVYVRVGTTWTLQQSILPPDAAAADFFGAPLALSGNTLVVGSPGGAYVFTRSGATWSYAQKLLPDDVQAADEFGHAIAIDGDLMVVGSRRADATAADSGSAYVFRRSSGVWSQEAKLTVPGAGEGAGAAFGSAVAVSGSTLLVGAPETVVAGEVAGAAYVFRHDGAGWSLRANLTRSAAGTTLFGAAVDVHSDAAIVASHVLAEDGTHYTFSFAYGPDLTPPTLGPAPDVVAEATSSAGAVVSYATPSATDNVDGPRPVSCAPASSSTFPLGTTPVECSATDVEGNVATVAFNVTVEDTTPPTIAPHDDEVRETANETGAVVTFTTPTAWDDVDGEVAVSCDPPSGSLFRSENTIVTCSASDARGNDATSHFRVTLRYVGAPPLEDRGDIAIGSTHDYGGEVPLAVDGDILAVGASENETLGTDAGAVRVFRRTDAGWTLETTLRPADGAPGDEFGRSVAADLGWLFAAAPGDDSLGTDAGSVHVFRNVDGAWTHVTELLPPGGVDGQLVASNGTLVVPGPRSNVYAFDGEAWVHVQTLEQQSGASDVRGDLVVLGDRHDSEAATSAGAAHVFQRVDGAWTRQAKLLPPAPQAHQAFGMSVGVGDGFIVVGSPWYDDAAVNSGSAYVFRGSGGSWTAAEKLNDTAAEEGDVFGERLVVARNYVYVTAQWASAIPEWPDSGLVHVFRDEGAGFVPRARLDDFYTYARAGQGLAVADAVAFVARSGSDLAQTVDVYGPDLTPPYFRAWALSPTEATSPEGALVENVEPSARDVVDGPRPVTCVPDPDSVFPIGTTIVSCSASDVEGNTNTTERTVIVEDTTPPTIAWHPDETHEATNASGAIVDYTPPSWTDVVSGNGTATCTPSSGSTFALGATAVNCSATDAAGNGATSAFNVTVQDTTPPAIEPHADVVVTTSGGSAVVSYALPAATDLVDGTVPVACSPEPGSTFLVGVVSVRCTAVDAAANVGSSSFLVRVLYEGAPPLEQRAKLLASDPQEDALFGSSVAIGDGIAVVGSPTSDQLGTDSGSAYLYLRTDGVWVEAARLLAPDGAAGDEFGRGVAVAGNVVAVGAPGRDHEGLADVGSVYVFHCDASGCAWQQTLLAPVPEANNLVGTNVAIAGAMVVNGRGETHVFASSGGVWSAEATLPDSGWEVAISGDTVVIGHVTDNTAALAGGAAHVYRRVDGAWVKEAKLLAGDAADYDQFGSSVAIDGDVIVVGAQSDDDPETNRGSAYVFRRNGTLWTQEAKLTASDLDERDYFGGSVAVSGDTVVVGSRGRNATAVSAGAAYVFLRSTDGSWWERAKLSAPDGASGDSFGHAVAARGGTALVGAWLADDGISDIGAVYVYGPDVTPPAIVVPPEPVVEATSADGAVVEYGEASATDNVDGPLPTSCAPASGITYPLGKTAVECSATDVEGNTGVASFNVTVQDTTPPTIEPHADAWAEASTASGAAVTYAPPAWTDAVDGTGTATCTPASGSTFPLGTTRVECSATDAAGNTATSAFNVTVQDTTPPAIEPHADETREATNASGATVSYVAPAWTDAVDGTGTATCTPASGSTFPLGTTRVECTASDAAGNTATSAFNVTVQDTTPPTIEPHADEVGEATNASGATVTYASPSWTDAVDGAGTATCLPSSGSLFPIGSTAVSCSATDAAGNTGTGTFDVTVQDTTPPAIEPHADALAEATNASGAAVTYAPPAWSDAVDGNGTATCTPASGETFALGTTAVACAATDAAGNTANSSFLVTVQDTTPPTIEPHADETREATNASGATVTYVPPGWTDLVDGAGTASCTPGSGSTFPLGKTRVDCSASDAAGNTATSAFNVTVEDTTPPSIEPHADETREAVNASGAVVEYVAPGWTDAVDGTGTSTCAPASGSLLPLGSTTVTCSATDAAGNTGASTFQAHVVDTTPPVIEPHADETHEANNASGAAVAYAPPAWTDAVDGSGLAACTPASGATFPLGATTVTCTHTDAAGNAATPVAFTVTIVDTTPPVIEPHADETHEATGPDGASVAYAPPSWTDAVDGTGAATCSPASGSTFPLGNSTVTCTHTDAAGNAATPVAFTITVVDTTAPAIAPHADVEVVANDSSGTTVTYEAPGWTDAVDGNGTATCSPASGVAYPTGETPVTCTHVDAAGNVGEGGFVVRVVATPPPAPTLQRVEPTAPGVLTVAWAPPDADGGFPITSYVVRRGSASDGPFGVVADGLTALEHADAGLPDGSAWWYTVAAVSDAGEGAQSTPREGATWDLPGAPALVSAEAGPGRGEATVAWTPPTEDGGTPLTAIVVERKRADEAEFAERARLDPATTAWTDSGLADRESVAYRLRAENAVGLGDPSATASLVTLDVPSPVQNLTVSRGVRNLTLRWEPPLDDGGVGLDGVWYVVFARHPTAGYWESISPHIPATSGPSEFQETGLQDLETRDYRVLAANVVGWSDPAERSGTTFGRPSAPREANVVAGPGPGELILDWEPAESDGGTPILHYEIRQTGGGSWVVTPDAPSNLTIGGFADGQQVELLVVAHNAAGEGAPSARVNATTFARPGAPREVAGQSGPDAEEVTFTWRPPADDGGAPILRYVIETARGRGDFTSETHVDARTFTWTTTAEPGETVRARVLAENVVGRGPASAEASAAAAPLPPPAPSEEDNDKICSSVAGAASTCSDGSSRAVLAVAAGARHTCVLLERGDVDCYGNNTFGQSDDLRIGRAVGVFAGDDSTCATLDDGTARCWGTSEWGKIPATRDDTKRVTIGGRLACFVSYDDVIECRGLDDLGLRDFNGRVVKDASAGEIHVCIIGADDLVECRGHSRSGAPPPDLRARQLSAGAWHTCALTMTWRVECWGDTDWGAGQSEPPADIQGRVRSVASGGQHVCALLDDGTVRCWGTNTDNQAAGDATGDAVAVVAGGLHSCVLTTSLETRCWGADRTGTGGYVFNDEGQADWYPRRLLG